MRSSSTEYPIRSHMALGSDEIFHHVMEKVTTEVPNSALQRYNVSQTADQLPDLKIRNALYRTELEAQIQEKREFEKRRRELEALEEEKLHRKIEFEREKLRREYLQEVDARTKTVTGPTPLVESPIAQDEARRRQQTFAKRLEEMQIEEARRRDEEAAKRKRALLETLYQKEFGEPKSAYSSYYFRQPWNSKDYIHGNPYSSNLKLTLDEIYTTAPMHILAEVYRNLEHEKLKLREIMRRRIARGDE